MTFTGPLALLAQVTGMFDDLGIAYALEGSMASSLVGEPRATGDIDLAARFEGDAGPRLLERASTSFIVPMDTARTAIASGGSFNLIDPHSALKVDVFALGNDLLDRRQLRRRQRVVVDDGLAVWVTAAEDQVLRKLDWYRMGGAVSERQLRDVVGILRVSAEAMDIDDLRAAADELGLRGLVDDALARAWQAGGTPGTTATPPDAR